MDVSPHNDGGVLIRLPDPEVAPFYRSALREQMGFRVFDVDETHVRVEPFEAARRLFDPCLIADARAPSSADWNAFERYPPGAVADEEARDRLRGFAVRLQERAGPSAKLRAIQAGIAAEAAILPTWLADQLPGVFADLPEASLWLVGTSPLIQARLRFVYAQFRWEVTPERSLDESELGNDPMSAHSLTGGIGDSHKLLNALLLLFSPSAIGYAFSSLPNSIVLLYGESKDIREPERDSLAELYEPALVGDRSGFPPATAQAWWDVGRDEARSLLGWWCQRLSIVYDHATDPTRFATEESVHQPDRQLGWLLSFERMLADATLILAGLQADPLARVSAAFDLLDKLESLLGYDRDQPGKGFQRLLNQAEGKPALLRSWDHLPLQNRQRFRAQTERLYAAVYAQTYEQALPYSRTSNQRVRVSHGHGVLVAEAMADYAPKLLRAIRNSSHGFVGGLATQDRQRLATHSGTVPSALPDLAVLFAIGAIADYERFVLGYDAWFERL